MSDTFSHIETTTHLNRKVGTLLPTFDIKDPQVRAFCDSLTNAWQLRNGNTGFDDKERFITKQEWDFLAKNPNILALAGLGQPGASVPEPGAPGGPGEGGGGGPGGFGGIPLIDFREILKNANELWATVYALTSEVHHNIQLSTAELDKLENDITQINTIEATSTSRSATSLYALKEQVNDPETGLPVATAGILEIEKVEVNQVTKSANAQKTQFLVATVNDPAHGNLANTAAIIEINKVSATSTSASAQRLAGLSASVGYDHEAGKAKVTADIAEINNVSATSSSASAQAVRGMQVEIYTPFEGLKAMIGAIETISVDSHSINARTLSGMQVTVGFKNRVFAQGTAPPVTTGTPPNDYTLKVNDIWINTANNNAMLRWTGSAWVDASDMRIGIAAAGVTAEQTARIEQDKVNASAVNTVWSYMGSDQNLVQDGATISLNPNAGVAHKWQAVQNETVGPSGNQKLVSQVRADLQAENLKNEGRANASYGLQVSASAGGKNVIAGMKLYAEANVSGANVSTCAFFADKFEIYNNATGAGLAPFAVENNIVKLNVVQVKDYITSGNYDYGARQGWAIHSNGNAAFFGITTMGAIRTGSVYLDNDSLQIISTLAQACYQSPGDEGRYIAAPGALYFYGPSYHGRGEALGQRLRNTYNGVPLVATFTFTGAVDTHVSLWRKYAYGGWEWLAGTEAYGDDYNPVGVAWSGTVDIGSQPYVQFGYSATNSGMAVGNSSKTLIYSYSASVVISNI